MRDKKSFSNGGEYKISILGRALGRAKQKLIQESISKSLLFMVSIFLVMLFLSMTFLSPEVTSKSDDVVGIWNFDEMEGKVLIDISSNKDNGRIIGATWSNGIIGSALKFDNKNDYVEISNKNHIYNLVGSWTIMAWVKPFSMGWDARNDPIIWKIANNGLDEDTFYLAWGRGNRFVTGLERASDDRDFSVSSKPHLPNRWYHVAGVYDGNSIKIYVNGKLENSKVIGKIIAYTGPAPLRIGNILNSNHGNRGVFNGIIDEVRIYKNALSTSEIKSIYESTKKNVKGGLIARWDFNENEGYTVHDSVNNINGKIYGAKWVDGINGDALYFDGKNDYVKIDDSSLLKPKEYSVEVWVKISSKQSSWSHHGSWVIGKEYNYAGYGIAIGGYEPAVYHSDGKTWHRLESNVDLTLDEWHQIVGTSDGETAKIYVDGELKNSHKYGFSNTNDPLIIGAWHGTNPSRYFNGIIDEVFLYNRPLTSLEIRQHYNNIKSKITLPSPLAEWRMDEIHWDGVVGEVMDSSGNGFDGVAVNGADTVDGKLCRAGRFMRSQKQYVDIGNRAELNPGNRNWSVSVWFKWYGGSGDQMVYDKEDKYNTSYYMVVREGGFLYYLWPPWGNLVNTGIRVTPGEWMHVVITYDHHYQRVYVNGVLRFSRGQSGDMVDSDGPFRIGNRYRYGANAPFNGEIDELCIWDTALTSSQIKIVYKNQKTGKNWDGSERNCSEVSTGYLSCSNLQPGLHMITYDTSNGYSGYPKNHWEYEALIQNYATIDNMYGSGIVYNINSAGNPFGSDDRYLSIFRGYIRIDEAGGYSFAVDGDDAVEVLIDGEVVAGWYGSHGRCGCTSHSGSILLDVGYHSLEFRHQEYYGADNYYLYWRIPGSRSYSIVPGGVLFHCGLPSPVGEWRFDECSWDGIVGEVVDSSGNGLDGTGMGGVDTVEAGVCRAGYFDGVDDYIELPVLDEDFSRGFTVMAWVDFQGGGSWERIIDFGNGAQNDNILFARQGSSDNLVFEVYSGGVSGGKVVAVDGIKSGLHHYAASIDVSGKVYIYRDGRLIGSGVSKYLPKSVVRTKNYIGRSNWVVDAYFKGYIDEVRIFDKPLQQIDIIQYMRERHTCGICCSNLEEGLLLLTYDTSDGYSGSPSDHASYEELINKFAKPQYLFGCDIVKNIDGAGNPFGSDDRYLSIFRGYIRIDEAGGYSFAVDGDDAVEVLIDGEVVAGWYGSHGRCGCTSHSGSILLDVGYHSLEFRHQEYYGADNYYLYWRIPGSRSYSIVPSDVFFHCEEKEEKPPATEYYDLVITDIYVDGKTVYYRIQNLGNGTINSSISHLYVDGKFVGEDTVDIMAGGQMNTEWFSYEIDLSENNHTVTVVADGNNAIEEINEDNNERTETFKAISSGKPDLIITSIYIDGETIYYRIQNIGSRMVESSYTYLYVDGKFVARDQVGIIAPCQTNTEWFDYKWHITGDRDEIKVVADGGNSVIEENEDNNEKIEYVTASQVGQPDLLISDIFVGGNRIYYRIQNAGEAIAGNSTTTLTINGKIVATNIERSIQPGEMITRSFTYTWIPLEENVTRIVTITADAMNVIEESDEDNNQRTETFAEENTTSTSTGNIDLVILDIFLSGNQINYRIQNLGDERVMSSTTYIYVNDELVGVDHVGIMAGGQTNTEGFDYPWRNLREGDVIKIVADGPNNIQETNELNNEKTYRV